MLLSEGDEDTFARRQAPRPHYLPGGRATDGLKEGDPLFHLAKDG